MQVVSGQVVDLHVDVVLHKAMDSSAHMTLHSTNMTRAKISFAAITQAAVLSPVPMKGRQHWMLSARDTATIVAACHLDLLSPSKMLRFSTSDEQHRGAIST